MIEKLREMIKNLGLTSEQCSPDRLKEVIKQWAKGCVGEDLPLNKTGTNFKTFGYNQAKAEIRKKIEEE
jgi:hypothetical protein